MRCLFLLLNSTVLSQTCILSSQQPLALHVQHFEVGTENQINDAVAFVEVIAIHDGVVKRIKQSYEIK